MIVEATFAAEQGDTATLEARMDDQLAKRDATQPVKDRSAGSTFRNLRAFPQRGGPMTFTTSRRGRSLMTPDCVVHRWAAHR